MDPTQNTSPDESALPNVPSQPQVGADPFNVAPVGSGESAAASAAPAPVTPPPVGGAAAWMPPAASADNAQQGHPPQVNVTAPAIADDGDVIEKEWVEKAKQIVARTRHDPYHQTRELHKYKAEYLQKRYNKTIEAVEE